MRSLLIPALAAMATASGAHADDLDLPAGIEFGVGLEVMTPVFGRLCEGHDVRTFDPAELPVAETSHVQVDCRGFEHAGSAREAEFVFADDRLVFVWILTEAGEEADHLAAMRARYGEPTHDTPAFVAHADDRVALRRDIPEFLYYGELVAPMYQAWFDRMAAS